MIKIYLDTRSIILAVKGTIYSKNYIQVDSAHQLAEFYSTFILTDEKEIIFVHSDISVLTDWFYSLFTVVSAAGGVVRADDKCLFIYRRNIWDLPKGKIDPGETIEEAAVREVEEECGISDLKIKNHITTTHHIYQHKEKLILKPTYWYAMTSPELEPKPEIEEGIEKAEWRTLNQLDDILENTFPGIIDVLKASSLI